MGMVLKELPLFLLLLHGAIGKDFDELVHSVGCTQEWYKREHKWLFARLGRRWGLRQSCAGTLHETAVEELAKLAVHLCVAVGDDIV